MIQPIYPSFEELYLLRFAAKLKRLQLNLPAHANAVVLLYITFAHKTGSVIQRCRAIAHSKPDPRLRKCQEMRWDGGANTFNLVN